jgi:hypothetical protein
MPGVEINLWILAVLSVLASANRWISECLLWSGSTAMMDALSSSQH